MSFKHKNFFFILCFLFLPLTGKAKEIKPFTSESNELKASEHKPPILTTTAIIEIYEEDDFKGIVLIERGKAPFGKAIPGGKVEYGETVENAVRREMLEEVNLELSDLIQFHVYSDPLRDCRHHSVEVAHVAKAFKLPKAGDDAVKAFLVKLDDIPWNELAFDHAQVLKDYIEWRDGSSNLSMVNNSSFEEKRTDLLKKLMTDLEIAQKNGNVNEEAEICARLTSIYFFKEDYDKTLEYASRCHSLSKEINDPPLFIRAFYLESAAYRHLAKKNDDKEVQQLYFAKAVKTAEYALEMYDSEALNDDKIKGRIYFNLASAYADNPIGDCKTALELYSLALKSFKHAAKENRGVTQDLIRTQICLGKAYLLQKSYESAQTIIDEIRPRITTEFVAMHIDYLEAQLKFALNHFDEAAKIAKDGIKKAKALEAQKDEKRFTELLHRIEDVFEGKF